MSILRELFIENSKKEFLSAVENLYPNNSGLTEYIKNMKDIDILYNHFELPEPKTLNEKIGNLIESNKILKTNKDYFKPSGIYYILEDIIYEEIINLLEDVDFNKVYETVMKGIKGIYKGDIPEGVQKKVARKIVEAKKAGHDTEKSAATILKKFKKYAADPKHRFFDSPVVRAGSRGGGGSSGFHRGPSGSGSSGFHGDPFDSEFHKAWEDIFGEKFSDSQAKWRKGQKAGRADHTWFGGERPFGSKTGSGFKSAGSDFGSRASAGFRSTGYNQAFKEYAESMAKYDREIARIDKISKIITITLLTVYVIGVTWSIYEAYFSLSVKTCKKKFPNNLTKYNKCVKEFKNRAKFQRIKNLQKGKLLCKKTKNPKKCEQKLNKKILEIRKSMR